MHPPDPLAPLSHNSEAPTAMTQIAALAPDVQRVLDERARQLARSPETEVVGESIRLLVLNVGTEQYGVDIQHVQEIEPLQRLTPIPGTPGFWAGVVNLRGNMHSVLDLGRYLNLPSTGGSEGGEVALVTSAGVSVGLLVDEVPEVRLVALSDIGSPVTESSGGRPEVVLGVTSDMLSVLDLETLLSDPSLQVEDDAGGA